MNDRVLERLNWSLIQSFLAVVDTASLARAAEATGQSQPTLSRQIAALEAELGAALFTRGARGSQLTDAGAALVEPARQMQQAAHALRRAAAGQSQSLDGTVRITASEAMTAVFLTRALAPLRQRHPEIQIDLVANNAQDDLLEREADIALRMLQPAQGTLVARRLGDVALGAWVSPAHLAAVGVARLGPPALPRLHWIGEDRQTHILSGMQRMGMRFGRERFAVRSDSDAVRWQALVAGLGAGFAFDAQAAQQPELLRVLPAAWIPPLPLWITAAQELRGNARMRCVFDHLAEALPPLLAVRPEAADPPFPQGAGPGGPPPGGAGSTD